MFRKCDSNHDTILKVSEVKACLKHAGMTKTQFAYAMKVFYRYSRYGVVNLSRFKKGYYMYKRWEKYQKSHKTTKKPTIKGAPSNKSETGRIFIQCDKDHDNMLSYPEIRNCLRANNMTATQSAQVMKFFYSASGTRYGYVSYSVFVKVYHRYERWSKTQYHHGRTGSNSSNYSNSSNTSNSSNSTKDQHNKTESAAKKIWRLCDANKDGKLYYTEAKKCLAKAGMTKT
jgi:Ca2+-binding EF-hand superfamily protein